MNNSYVKYEKITLWTAITRYEIRNPWDYSALDHILDQMDACIECKILNSDAEELDLVPKSQTSLAS